jgi:choline dehydrogenase-like flavoprotein
MQIQDLRSVGRFAIRTPFYHRPRPTFVSCFHRARSGQYDQAQFVDVAHPTGTTRMAHDPREGVVDENCQVHGVDGIFVAGSSVFPNYRSCQPDSDDRGACDTFSGLAQGATIRLGAFA